MSKKIKILGTGCPKCQQTTAVVSHVVNENHIDATIEKVDDIMDIMKYDVMATPAVVIDEKVMLNGRVPTADEILKLLQ